MEQWTFGQRMAALHACEFSNGFTETLKLKICIRSHCPFEFCLLGVAIDLKSR